MGNGHSKKFKERKGNFHQDTRSTSNPPDSLTRPLSPYNTITSTQSTQPPDSDTRSKKSQSKVKRVSSLFEQTSNTEGDSRRKPLRMLSPLLPKKSRDTQEEREDASTNTDYPASTDYIITEETVVSPLSTNDTGDYLIARAIQAAAEATGSVGYDEPWPGPSSLPVNKPKSQQQIATSLLSNNQSGGSTESISQQLYHMAEQAGERKKEVDRHTRQHYLLKQLFGGIHQSPLNSPHDIIHLGCGTGVWCVEMAQKYPLAHVNGWALDPPTVSVPEALQNLNFVKKDLFQPAAGLTAVPNSTIDFIYIRDVAYAVTSNEQWISVIHEAYRVLRPGGWIEITEPDFTSIKPGPHFAKLIQVHKSAIEKAGMDPQYTHHIMSYFNNENYAECKEVSTTIPIGEWPLDSSKDQIIRRFQAMKQWYITLDGITDEEFDSLWQACLEENEKGTMIQWKVFYAQKPVA